MERAIDAQTYLMGYVPIIMLDLLARHKLMPIADYPTGPGFVTKAEAATVMERAKRGIRLRKRSNRALRTTTLGMPGLRRAQEAC